MDNKYTKIQTAACGAPLKVRPGHYATNHAHLNYYLDMTTLRTRLSEAEQAAECLAGLFLYDTPVDTIVCLEGSQVIGAMLAQKLTNAGVLSMNAHKTMYIATPEYNSSGQLIFKENILPMIRGKNILLLTMTVSTGLSVSQGIEAVGYYGGCLRAVTAVFSAVSEAEGHRILSIFGKKDLPDYGCYDFRNCPLCREGRKLNALVNAFGYSDL